MIGETAPSASSANASWGLQGPPRTFNPSKEYQDKVGVPEASGNYIDQAKSTVSGQLDQILSSDSALMRRAENFAGAKSNKTGMLGSSMATGAAQGAMIDKALPIAQQDAALYGQQDLSQQAQDFSKESQAIQQNYGIDTAAQQQVNVLSQMDKSQIGALELADQQFGYTQEITKNDQIFQELMTDKKYTQDDKVLMMNSSKDIMRDYMSSLVKAQTSGEFTEAEAKAATDNYNSAMGTLFSIWDTDMSFSF
jgi:hypothetical protein